MPPMNPSGTTDVVSKTGNGKFGIDYATNIIPLNNGWILYGDFTNNKIQSVNIFYGILGSSYQLSATPGDLAYDATNGFLYAALSGATSLAKVNLNTGVVTTISLPSQAVHLAATNTGYVFASLSNNSPQTICYINGSTGTIVASPTITDFGLNVYLACNSAGTTVFFGCDGGSGCSTYQYLFNTSTYALTQQYSVFGYAENGEEMDISPDNNHLAFVNGGGNGGTGTNTYSIFDLSTSNINSSNGSWLTGAYPTSAGFSPDSANVATTNDSALQVFSVGTHSSSKTTWTGASAGSVSNPTNIYELKRVCFSRGGAYVFGLDVPTYTMPAPSTIVWETFP